MRHSVLLRLLGLSLAVAVFAIAATAWLTSRDTSERFRGEFERTLEADTFIYQGLSEYASRNDSWDGVDTVVAELAERTGRRVALTTLDGDVLADSAAISGQPAPALASTPTAEIDALSGQFQGVETTVVGYQGDTFVAETMDTMALHDISDPYSLRGTVGQLAVSAAAPSSVSPVWRLDPDEAAARFSLAADAQECLKEDLDLDDEVMVTPSGEVLLLGDAYVEKVLRGVVSEDHSGEFVQGLNSLDLGGAAAHSCLPAELFEASDAALAFNRQEINLLEECLDNGNVPHMVVDVEAGLKRVIPEPSAHGDLSSLDETEWNHWIDCEQSAWNETMEDFVAEPALLYSGDAGRFDPFFGDGWWRTTLAGLAVLAAATGVTVLVGRRLTRPIHALTTAATRMGEGDHSARVDVGGQSELARLGTAFNSMAESIETNERQRKAMVSDVAHELRTPLSNVRGYLEAAEDGVVPLDRALVSSLLEESGLLERLIDDLQDLALADAGKLRVHPQEVDAEQLARHVVAVQGASADDAGVSIELESESATVVVDPERLRQALGNLVANAVRFSDDGAHVTVRVRPEDAEGDWVLFTVEDDGPGIPEEHVPRLFDRFYRVEQSRSRATGGSGLGLAITKHLVEAHGGTISVESTVGEGSVFTIRLPARIPVPTT
ncbi:sensor histidine kinase [Phytoactinopolyspora mesophila]|uniref:histidine kinase n=1 Tax=Phytoactinopolyspora mesophila TaxID=2650750 RepID=A0A7K3M6I0_9ACTN|nr:HAMP domain-containing sensor histidine kinase [Phytoactinopolyspora mesophila]NDL58028.1 HAMP domain-containing protein [Phytoactinopolyspora mesophila]